MSWTFRTVLALGFVAVGLFFIPAPGWAATRVTCNAPRSEQSAPTEYFVSLSDAARHLAHVSIRIPQGNGPLTLDMPVWNALYQVRNFAANIESVQAQDATGANLEVYHSNTSEWQVAVPAGCVVVSYDIHLDDPGPFGAQLNSEHGFFNWAMVLMYAPALRLQPASIQLLDVPPSWALRGVHIFDGAAPGKASQVTGTAPSYDDLVDSPVEAGDFQQAEFLQDGVTYHIVVHGDPRDYNMAKIEEILRRITHAAMDWMQDRPLAEYTFLYHFPRGLAGGGMEHAYGTAIDVSADRLLQNSQAIADVSAHEFFHLWNVKRIRPQSLEPIDYQHEQDTRALWFSEGVTSTVADLIRARAGIITEQHFLNSVGRMITELQSRPAHLWQSAEESSLDAWFEGDSFYGSPQRSISYYNKGEILGILLDLRMRELTNDTKSLRDLFQWMNQHYAKQHQYFHDSAGVEEAVETITGQTFAAFFRDYVAGVQEIPYNDFFKFAGLQVVTKTVSVASAGFSTTTTFAGPPEVVEVESNSAAEAGGVSKGDRVLTINGRPASGPLESDIAGRKPGDTIKLTISHSGHERKLKMRLGSRAETAYEVQELPVVSAEQRAHRTAWIHGDDEIGTVQ